MIIRFHKIFDTITSNPKKLFLIDGISAALTTFFVGILLVRFENSFGMPRTILYMLSSIAGIYAIYSIGCYFILVSKWRPFLKGIIIANFTYYSLTISLVFYFYQKLTILGLIYFILELIIISGLIIIELIALSKFIDRKI